MLNVPAVATVVSLLGTFGVDADAEDEQAGQGRGFVIPETKELVLWDGYKALHHMNRTGEIPMRMQLRKSNPKQASDMSGMKRGGRKKC